MKRSYSGKKDKTAKSHGSMPKSSGVSGGVKHKLTKADDWKVAAKHPKHRKGM